MHIRDTNAPEAQSVAEGGGADAGARQNLIPLKRRLASLFSSALDLILPPLCLGCQTRLDSHDALCPTCWRGIDFVRPPLCDKLGIPLPYHTGGLMVSAAAVAHPPAFERARAVALCDGLMRDLVHSFKFRDIHNARRLFGRWLVEAGGELLADADVIIPVPLTRWRLLSRRFNQAQLLAAEVHKLTGKPVSVSALTRTRSTAHQVGLSRGQRERNVAGAFAVNGVNVADISGRAVLLIDDVMTTGATASAAARALKAARASRVDVLVLALVADAAT
jgi:ComF family protein